MKDRICWENKDGMLYSLPPTVKEGQQGTYEITPSCFKGHPFDLKVRYVETYVDGNLVWRLLVMVSDTEGYVNAIKELGYTKEL